MVLLEKIDTNMALEKIVNYIFEISQQCELPERFDIKVKGGGAELTIRRKPVKYLSALKDNYEK